MQLPEWAIVIYDFLLFTGMAIIYISEAIILTFIPRRYRVKSVKGEIALITGGAGGIGRLIAIKLANLGAHVVIWDINKTGKSKYSLILKKEKNINYLCLHERSGLKDTVQEIRSSGGKCWGYYCDITSREEVYRMAKIVQIEVGSVSKIAK